MESHGKKHGKNLFSKSSFWLDSSHLTRIQCERWNTFLRTLSYVSFIRSFEGLRPKRRCCTKRNVGEESEGNSPNPNGPSCVQFLSASGWMAEKARTCLAGQIRSHLESWAHLCLKMMQIWASCMLKCAPRNRLPVALDGIRLLSWSNRRSVVHWLEMMHILIMCEQNGHFKHKRKKNSGILTTRVLAVFSEIRPSTQATGAQHASWPGESHCRSLQKNRRWGFLSIRLR